MTVSTLEGIAERLKALERLIDVRFEAAEKALEVAKNESDRRLEGMNEFRSQLTQQAQEFMSKSEFELQHKALMDKVELTVMRFEDRCKVVEARMHGVELMKADITGRIWTLGILGAIVLIVLEALLHYVAKSNFP